VATTAPELTFSLAEDLSTDGMGELAELQPQNVMYEQDKDKPFEPLPARITSESSLVNYAAVRSCYCIRTLLYQQLWHGDTP
jgi:hypothetical protein